MSDAMFQANRSGSKQSMSRRTVISIYTVITMCSI